MSALTSVTSWLVRLAARRWPADVRDEMIREWEAELAALTHEGGRPAGRLGFALSLAASPPVTDESGVPRGWRESLPGLGPAVKPSAALVLAALAVLALRRIGLADVALAPFGIDFVHPWFPLLSHLIDGAVAVVLCLFAGLMLGRRLPMAAAHTGRFGRAGSAAYAPAALTAAILVTLWAGQSGVYYLGLLLLVVTWVPLSAALAVAVVRRRLAGRGWSAAGLALIGAPVVTAAASAIAALPAILFATGGPGHGLRAYLGMLPWREPNFPFIDEASTDGRIWAVQEVATFPVMLVPYLALALAYGWSASRHRLLPEVDVAAYLPAEPGMSVAQSPRVVAAGAAVLAGAVALWAYTVAVLTPAMSRVSERAPMPGGDGELYLWVAELRWAAIVLAGLALLVGTAARRNTPLAAGALIGVLLVADGILDRTGAGLRVALAVGAVLAGLAWLLAGGPLHGTDVEARRARRRLGTAAITAAVGPLLYLQGTPAVNHPFLPVLLPVATVAVAVLFVVLAGVAAQSARTIPLRPWAAVALPAVPAALLVALGLFIGNGIAEEIASVGVLLAVPLAMVVAVVVRGRPRRRWLWWTGLALSIPAGPIGTLVLVYLMFVPDLLFALAGTGYPADGLSVLPAAILVALPVAAALANRPAVAPAPPLAARSLDPVGVPAKPPPLTPA